jgi:hypothetical protein
MKRLKGCGILMMLSLIMACPMRAEEADSTSSEVEFNASADLVSSYLCRGAKVSGASFQPTFSVSYKGLSLSAWASSDFKTVVNEFDWILGYEVGGFSMALTDYFGPYEDGATPKYFADNSHMLEGTVGFDFSAVCKKFALSITWNTYFLNDKDAEGDEQFSTYIELGYPVHTKPATLDFAMGFTPWEGVYSSGFNVVNLSIKATKEIKITDSYSLPIFTQVVLNPNTENIFGVFGVSF